MIDKRFKDVIEFIAAFLVDATGNEIFENWKEKRKIAKILKEDNKNIKRIFFTVDNSELYNLIEEFIIFSAFKEVSFYSPFDLTIEQEENLWRRFSDFIKSETGDGYVSGEYKKKIIQCINLHNKAISNIIMDSKDVLQMKVMQKQHEAINDSLNGIVNTLNTETKLQDEDEELNFSVEQIEMIMKSYRYDLNQLRKMQIVSIYGVIGIIISMSVFIPLSLGEIRNNYSIVAIFSFFIMVVCLILMFWIHITIQAKAIGRKIESMRGNLLYLHYDLYSSQIKKMYKISDDIEERNCYDESPGSLYEEIDI